MTRIMDVLKFFAQKNTQSAATMWHTFRHFFGNREVGIGGVAAVEFAIVAPPLILLMVCTADVGMGMYRKLQVQNAAQIGSAYAVAHGFQADSISNAVRSATAFSSIVAQPTPSQSCGCASNTGVTSAACNSTCVDGTISGTYVTVSAQGSYTTLLPYPVLPNTFTFVNQSTVRIQ